jgi:hypothetical protein
MDFICPSRILRYLDAHRVSRKYTFLGPRFQAAPPYYLRSDSCPRAKKHLTTLRLPAPSRRISRCRFTRSRLPEKPQPKPAKPSEIDGTWQGTLEAGGRKLRIVFHVINTTEGPQCHDG